MKITIAITEEHIKHGIRKSAADCPVKLAIDEVVRSNVLVRAGYYLTMRELGSVDSTRVFVARLVELRCWMGRFDCGLPVKPITFEIDIPNWFLKPIK
jgi:hypothetical protein